MKPPLQNWKPILNVWYHQKCKRSFSRWQSTKCSVECFSKKSVIFSINLVMDGRKPKGRRSFKTWRPALRLFRSIHSPCWFLSTDRMNTKKSERFLSSNRIVKIKDEECWRRMVKEKRGWQVRKQEMSHRKKGKNFLSTPFSSPRLFFFLTSPFSSLFSFPNVH